MAEESLEKTCLRGLSFTIEDNAKKCRPIHIDTVKAFVWNTLTPIGTVYQK